MKCYTCSEKGDTSNKEQINLQFYGPATNCGELEKLGFTLNGYYLVKANEESNPIEVVFCRFKFPRESKTSKK